MASFDPDYVLALQLQAKYNKEEVKKERHSAKVRVVNETVLPPLSGSSVVRHGTNSIVDPVWETTDPTPDIHALFLAFNQRFFWGALGSIEVCWSARMKLCAGVCVYQNKNGFCSVRLSAPLLKLRPRSDLVETLLHELIHAYLFVTHNDRDRDSHGPVFQSHMRRINREAGTNITIYHNFNDEVDLYRQHWWRCNGPCRTRRPYFGFVKRSMNRAPGPNDRWWPDHRASCNGKFIKIKEPAAPNEKKQKKNGSSESIKISSHSKITGFLKPTNDFNNKVGKNGPILSTGNMPKKIVGINDTSNQNFQTRPSNNSPTIGSNVHGFIDLTSNNPTIGAISKSKVANKSEMGKGKQINRTSSAGRGGMLANRGGGTLVVTNKNQKKGENEVERKINVVPFSGAGYVLGRKPIEEDAMLCSEKNVLGKSKLSSRNYVKVKKPRLENVSEEVHGFQMENKCPVCGLKLSRNGMQSHLEKCNSLSNLFNNENYFETNKCLTCNTDVSEVDTEEHSKNCVDLIDEFPNDSSQNETCRCPVCNINIHRSVMNSHLDECAGLSRVFNDSSTLEDSDEEDETNKVPCPCCNKNVDEAQINEHLDECLTVASLKEVV